MIEPGQARPLGATRVERGVNFSVYAGNATRVELCLFRRDGGEQQRYDLLDAGDGYWHGFLPGCGIGQLYGYRVHGDYAPENGLRHNPAKLLVDPYARALHGEFTWHPAVFGYQHGKRPRSSPPSTSDSAPYVPKAVVVDDLPLPAPGPRVPWAETVFYELNVRGYTMRHPAVAEAARGRFNGMTNGEVVAYLRALGITAVELMPVHYFIDEHFLARRGLRNYWGYNSINFFTPAERYGCVDARAEFVDMVNALHDAGLEVILDVVYNHTAEGDGSGPTLSFRGFDNAAYYRLVEDEPAHYINDTGCGNTLNPDSPVVQDLVVDSLRYWATHMGCDGFRFDLAPVLGRGSRGFDPRHEMLERIQSDAVLRNRKLVAEPWDPGPGGYQLGQFESPWAEWNDRFRDTVRRWWRGDPQVSGEFARRLHGSSDIFEPGGRPASASINFLTSHDGFTLADVVSYVHRHNEANGEDNRDGHHHNFSTNFGVEGTTRDAAINAARAQRRRNMLATLILAQGTPMLLAGDEFGHSQRGNNNAYAQDNEIAWLDWDRLDSRDSLLGDVRTLLALRRDEPLLRGEKHTHGNVEVRPGWPDIAWLSPAGRNMTEADWHDGRAFTLLLAEATDGRTRALALMLNNSNVEIAFSLGEHGGDLEWRVRYSTAGRLADGWRLPPGSLACLTAAPAQNS